MSYDDDEVYPVPGWDSSEWDRVLLHRSDIARAGGPGNWVFYRPGRLVLDAEALHDERVISLLRRHDAEPAHERAADVVKELGLVLLNAPDDRIVKLVAQLRAAVPCCASLDHVLVAGPARWHGDDLPVPTDNPGDIPGRGEAGAGLTIAVLDTGIDGDVPFPVQSGGGDGEVADEDGDKRRDPPAGHGTHIAGIIARTAPGAEIVAHRVLRTVAGQASEIEVAEALLGLPKVDLVNCSFSGPVLGDAQPLVVERALGKLARSTVVVGCAGNAGNDRIQWPAASTRVIAVGAIARDDPSQPWRRTDFSSYGSWCDACAPGVSVPSAFLHFDDFAGWARWSGTSFSAPQVVASIAAVATGGDVAGAAYKLVRDPARPRVPRLGAIVDPADLP
jgi:subtilisin family serine protease